MPYRKEQRLNEELNHSRVPKINRFFVNPSHDDDNANINAMDPKTLPSPLQLGKYWILKADYVNPFFLFYLHDIEKNAYAFVEYYPATKSIKSLYNEEFGPDNPIMSAIDVILAHFGFRASLNAEDKDYACLAVVSNSIGDVTSQPGNHGGHRIIPQLFQATNTSLTPPTPFLVKRNSYLITGISVIAEDPPYYVFHIFNINNTRAKGARYYPHNACLTSLDGQNPLGLNSPLREEGIIEQILTHFGYSPENSSHMQLGNVTRNRSPCV